MPVDKVKAGIQILYIGLNRKGENDDQGDKAIRELAKRESYLDKVEVGHPTGKVHSNGVGMWRCADLQACSLGYSSIESGCLASRSSHW